MRMKLSDFNYELPKELVAEYPNKTRDEAKLMVIDRKDYSIQHLQFKDMIEYFNETHNSINLLVHFRKLLECDYYKEYVSNTNKDS